MTPLEDARTALAASTQVADPQLATIYIAAARVVLNHERKELDAREVVIAAREVVIAAREAALLRLMGGDTKQLTIPGAK